MADAQIAVNMYKRPDKSLYIRIELRAPQNRKYKSFKELNLDDFDTEAECLKAADIAGGALAEHRCQMHNEDHDPASCAVTARKACERLFAKMQSGSSDMVN